jgi:hypothetical protein
VQTTILLLLPPSCGCSLQGPLVCVCTDSVQAQLKLPAQLLHIALCLGSFVLCWDDYRLHGVPHAWDACASITVPLLLVLGLVQLAGP